VWNKLVRALRDKPQAGNAPQGLAVAVLLLETARADFEHADEEIAAARHILAGMFALDAAGLDALIAEATAEARRAVSLHAFVAELNASLDAVAKRDLIAALWRVAHADGRLHPQEEHLIRRLADLLHVPHHEFVRQKLATGQQ
jgi:uncharacterized tellurite resistance protein B-like protein